MVVPQKARKGDGTISTATSQRLTDARISQRISPFNHLMKFYKDNSKHMPFAKRGTCRYYNRFNFTTLNYIIMYTSFNCI